MKMFRIVGMALIAILVCVNLSSCNDDEEELWQPIVYDNTIIYITSDTAAISNYDVRAFGGAKILSHTYSEEKVMAKLFLNHLL